MKYASSHVCSTVIVGDALAEEDRGDRVALECHDDGPLAVSGPHGPVSGTWSPGTAETPEGAPRAGDTRVAARLTDLALAAAFAGGLGVGSELDGSLARAAELLGSEVYGLDLGDALLVAQVLAGGVAEVPGSPRAAATRQSFNAGDTTRAT